MTSENTECIGIVIGLPLCVSKEPTIFTAGSEPNIFGQIIGCHKCRLFAFDYGNRFAPVHRQEMFTEKTLTQVEVGQLQQRVNPCNMVERELYTFAVVGIIEHDFPGTNTAVDVGLPEHA